LQREDNKENTIRNSTKDKSTRATEQKRDQTDSVIYTVGRLRQRLELWGTLQVKYKV